MGKKNQPKTKKQKATDPTITGTFKTKFLYAHHDVVCKSGLGEKVSEADTSNAFCGNRQLPIFIINHNKKQN